MSRKEYTKQWRKENKEHIKQYRINNKEKKKKWERQYYIINKERLVKMMKQYNIDNQERLKDYANQYRKNRKKVDLKFNLNCKMTSAIWYSVKGNKNGRKWENLVGYTCDALIKYLKKTMPKGYTWQDYISGKLAVDHIIPISVFNFTKAEHTDFKRCWALENLRLLPARENKTKGAKLLKPFQPSLAI